MECLSSALREREAGRGRPPLAREAMGRPAPPRRPAHSQDTPGGSRFLSLRRYAALWRDGGRARGRVGGGTAERTRAGTRELIRFLF